MGLLGDIGKFVGGAVKTVSSFLPGPIGAVGGAVGGLLSGGGGSRATAPTLPGRSEPFLPGGTSPGIMGGVGDIIRYTPWAGAANAFSDLTGSSFAQGGRNLPTGIASDVAGVEYVQEARAPRGFRVHRLTPTTVPFFPGMKVGDAVAVRLGSHAARVLGVRRSKKPVLSVRDSEALRRAARAKKKVQRIAKGAGLHVYANARR